VNVEVEDRAGGRTVGADMEIHLALSATFVFVCSGNGHH